MAGELALLLSPLYCAFGGASTKNSEHEFCIVPKTEHEFLHNLSVEMHNWKKRYAKLKEQQNSVPTLFHYSFADMTLLWYKRSNFEYDLFPRENDPLVMVQHFWR